MKHILSIFIFFIASFGYTFWNNNLEISSEKVSIHDSVQLLLTLTSSWDTIEISDFSWLDNFDIISQNIQEQSYNIFENGNATTQKQIILKLDVQPKTVGTFTLWPVWFEVNNTQLQTNSVTLEVTSDATQTPSSILNTLENINNIPLHNIQDKIFNQYYYYIISILLWLIFLSGLFAFRRKNPSVSNLPLWKDDWAKENIITETEKIYSCEDVPFPDITQENFENILYQKFLAYIQNTYHIENINLKTKQEIMDSLDESERKKIRDIFQLLTYLKYSPSKENKKEALEMLKNYINQENN